MIFIKEQSLNKVWRTAVKELMENGYTPQDKRFIKIESMAIEIENPKLEDIDEYFPMTQEDIKIINNYITTGENEEKVCHEWTCMREHVMYIINF